jgi:hypothetical protein
MPNANTVDRQSELLYTMLIIVGAILGVVGWYVWAT